MEDHSQPSGLEVVPQVPPPIHPAHSHVDLPELVENRFASTAQGYGMYGNDAPEVSPDAYSPATGLPRTCQNFAPAGSDAPQVAPGTYLPENEAERAGQGYNPAWCDGPQVTPSKSLPEPLYPGDYANAEWRRQGYDAIWYSGPDTVATETARTDRSSSAGWQKEKAEPKVLGLRKPKFYWLAGLVAVILVAAIVGGAVGGTVGRHSSSPSGDAGSMPASLVLNNSQITSANWTDGNGVAYHAAFWQSSSSDLMVSLWDSTSGNWRASNITGNISSTAGFARPKPGTPLAAAVKTVPWTVFSYVALFYLSPENTLEEVWTRDITGASGWEAAGLSTAEVKWRTADNSRLAATRQLCGSLGCDSNIWVLYEDSNQTIRLANESDWTVMPTKLLSNIVSGSGIAITGTTMWQDENWDDYVLPKMYYQTGTQLQEAVRYDAGPWVTGTNITTSLTAATPQLAVINSAPASNLALGPVEVFVLSTFVNGSVMLNHFDNHTWSGSLVPSITGAPYRNFTSGTMVSGANLSFYGLAGDGTIQSFTINRKNTLQWAYDGPVLNSTYGHEGIANPS